MGEDKKDVLQPMRANRWLLSPEIQKRYIEEDEWYAVKKSMEQRNAKLREYELMGNSKRQAVKVRDRKLEEERRRAVEEEEKCGWRWL